MIRISAARRAQRKGLDLNMAPLIDMVFILLIFFLVTTSFVKEAGVDVKRPRAKSAYISDKSAILVAVTSQNRLYMENKQIDIRSLPRLLERALVENPGGQVIVVADEESSTGVVVRVMDAARTAGAKAVSIAASRVQGP